MNKRTKKKRLLANLLAANNLQQEVIEAYGNQLAQVKRELAELRAIVERNAEVTNNRFDQLEAENKALRIDLDEVIFEFNKPKKSWFGRK